MINRTVAASLSFLLTFLIFSQQSVIASSGTEKDVARTQKVKTGILQLGTGPSSRVNLTLKDKTRVAGYVSEIREDAFVVTEEKSGRLTTVAYPDVTQVKGHNLSTRTKVIIGVAIAVGVAITLYLVRGAFCDGC